jgi:methylated-DNA-protein-cysteine methyltransferase-like protein
MRSNMGDQQLEEDKTGAQHACTAPLSASAAARRDALYLSLAQVPSGCVVSYGQLAAMAGLGKAARWVGRTLSQLPEGSSLPWHRVVSACGHLSLAQGTVSGAEQRQRLREEGIHLTNDRVDIHLHGWRP